MNTANRLSLSRICLVPIFIALLLYFTPERPFLHTAAVLVFLIACASDALDGYLARKLRQQTELGSYIDPLADKLLLLSGFLCLSLMAHLPAAMHVPAWVTITIISRDVVILFGAIIIFFTTGSLRPKPLLIGKITTVAQMSTLVASLLMLPEPLRWWCFVGTFVLTVVSGAVYIHMGGILLQES